MSNGVQLLAYADRFGGEGLPGLRDLLTGPLEGLFSGIHVLPFFHPYDGADAGFDPIDHLKVDSRLGSWSDVKALADVVDVTADLIVNHISADSPQFVDYLRHGEASPFAGMFLTADKVFPDGAADKALGKVYRPRPSSPFTSKLVGNGEERHLWTTFTAQQIDIDVNDTVAQQYLLDILDTLAAHNVDTVRLDAVGYAVKRVGTSCFMTEETFLFVERMAQWTQERDMRALAEVHAHFQYQLETAKHVDLVYDFALPPLVLHSLFSGRAVELKSWFELCPQNVITVLDTHDGIGVMDVGASPLDVATEGLLAPEDINAMVERIHHNSGGVSKRASQQDVGNLDLYQVNCTYYDALGRDDRDYLLARLIQMFAPGTPQIYYVGLLAGENDTAQLGETRWGRDVNRRYYSRSDILRELEKPVVQSLLGMIRFRNQTAAFDGTFEIIESADYVLHIRREHQQSRVDLRIDLASREFEVTEAGRAKSQSISRFTQFY